MRMPIRLVCTAILSGLFTTAVIAIELEPGRQYDAGTRVESTADGVSFVVPQGWFGGVPPQSSAFVIGSNTIAGMGLVIMRQSAGWEDVQAYLNQPQDLGDGVVLVPVTQGRMTDGRYEIELGNQLYRGLAVGMVGDTGNAAVIFFGGPAAESHRYLEFARATAASVEFTSPRQTAEQQQWQSLLAGMMLRRMSSYYSGGLDGAYAGGSSSETLHLCSDGSYAYSSSSTIAADAGGGTSGYAGDTGISRGTWSIESMGAQTVLTLRSESGEFSQHSMQYSDGSTYLDGERVYRVQSDRCN